MDNNYFMPRGGYAPSYLATTNANANTNIIWTMGIESAKAYPLYPGRTILLMDSESPRFFIKTMDNNGYATLRTFTFQEEALPASPDTPNYVTQEQLDATIAAVIERFAAKDSPKSLL